MNDLFPIPQQDFQPLRERHICNYDWAVGRNDLLVCGENKIHKTLALGDRRAKVLAGLLADGMLVGRALIEAEAVGAQPAEEIVTFNLN